MAGLKPIIVWVHVGGPNPFKVLLALEELGIAYEKVVVEKPKEQSFLAINPNGRLPAIKDPNHDDLVLWESGAILEYIVDTYDKEGKLTLTSHADKWHLKQYLHFQMSGQGPYYGQGIWFKKYHPEDVPRAKKRYDEQTFRVIDVLNTILDGKKYLVGDKFTYADLAFFPWDYAVKNYTPEFWDTYQVKSKYPNYVAWFERMLERPSVKKVYGL